jgi:hypothetical protein
MLPPGYVGCKLSAFAYVLPPSLSGAPYQTPVIEPDGSIVYTPTKNLPPPPKVAGYKTDPDNPWRFTPLWPDCTTRRGSISQHPRLGIIRIFMTCNSPECKRLGKVLTPEMCRHCDYRTDFSPTAEVSSQPPPQATKKLVYGRPVTVNADNSIIYDKQDDEDWEPPREINGYIRDPENAWRFIPIIWPACTLRTTKTLLKKNCGCWDFDVRCTCAECSLNTQPVTHLDCEKCAFRVDK